MGITWEGCSARAVEVVGRADGAVAAEGHRREQVAVVAEEHVRLPARAPGRAAAQRVRARQLEVLEVLRTELADHATHARTRRTRRTQWVNLMPVNVGMLLSAAATKSAIGRSTLVMDGMW